MSNLIKASRGGSHSQKRPLASGNLDEWRRLEHLERLSRLYQIFGCALMETAHETFSRGLAFARTPTSCRKSERMAVKGRRSDETRRTRARAASLQAADSGPSGWSDTWRLYRVVSSFALQRPYAVQCTCLRIFQNTATREIRFGKNCSGGHFPKPQRQSADSKRTPPTISSPHGHVSSFLPFSISRVSTVLFTRIVHAFEATVLPRRGLL